jgi:hypothetical protein
MPFIYAFDGMVPSNERRGKGVLAALFCILRYFFPQGAFCTFTGAVCPLRVFALISKLEE